MTIEMWIVLALLCAAVGAMLAESRGKSRVEAFLACLLLGPLGLAILALKRPIPPRR